MSPVFAYVYFMADAPDLVRTVAPEHAAYWHRLGLSDYRGGPFDDRAGGLITFVAGSVEEAERAVAGDPFVTAGAVNERWLKQWRPERGVGATPPSA